MTDSTEPPLNPEHPIPLGFCQCGCSANQNHPEVQDIMPALSSWESR